MSERLIIIFFVLLGVVFSYPVSTSKFVSDAFYWVVFLIDLFKNI